MGGAPPPFTGQPGALCVRDVTEVAIGSEIRKGSATQDGEEALLGSAIMLTGENSRLVAQRVHERVAEIQKKLPAGVFIETLYNRTDVVNYKINMRVAKPDVPAAAMAAAAGGSSVPGTQLAIL